MSPLRGRALWSGRRKQTLCWPRCSWTGLRLRRGRGSSHRAEACRCVAASLLDDLGHTVRTRFPYPVASRWRETEAQTSAGPSQGAYAAVLDTTEILLCYTAQLALALAWSSDIELGSATASKDKLSAGRGGPEFGDWAFVLQEVSTSRKLRALPPGHPLHDLRSLLDNKEWLYRAVVGSGTDLGERSRSVIGQVASRL